MMKTIYRVTLILLISISTGAYAAEQGVVRNIASDYQQLTIDEIRYPLSPALRVNNLGEGLNEIAYTQVGQPVRFTRDETGRITELWLYPLHAAERKELGISLGDEQQ